jgi:heme oxygenase (mycobilin-producing)
MFIAISHFTVANNTHDAVAEAFLQRPHLVDGSEGFIRMEVWNPEKTPHNLC